MAENDAFRVKKRINLKENTTAGEDPGDIRYDGSGNLQLRDGSAEKTVLDEDNSVTVINKSVDANNNTLTNIGDDELTTGINANKLADGSVSNTEYQYLGNVTSDIQTQIDSKADDADLTSHVSDATDAHDGSAISYDNSVSGLLATDVQAAIDENNVLADAIDSDLTSHVNATSVHGLSGDVVGTTDTQDLAGKTFTDAVTLEEQSSTPSTPSSGDKKLYAKDDGKLYTLDDTGTETEVGSGAGGSGILYINEDFEANVDELVAYADTAQDTPVDGTGGSPNVVVSVETTNNLVGVQSAKIAKDASNRQGEGAAIISDTVDDAYSDKVHTVELLWKTDSNYSDGDMALFVVHPTTGTVEALNFRTALGEYTNELPASSDSVLRIVSELTPIDDTYRIVLHVKSTSTTAYDVYVDNIQTGPQRTFNAPIITEWQDWTPTVTPTNFSITTAKYRRVGSVMEAYVEGSASGTTSGNNVFTIPSGLTIDSGVSGGDSFGSILGPGTVEDVSASTFYLVSAVYISDTEVGFRPRDKNWGGDNYVRHIGFQSLDNGDVVRLEFSVPIEEWDAGAVLSSTQVDQKSVNFYAEGNGGGSVTGGTTDIDFTEVDDPFNAWDGTTFTAPARMRVNFSGSIRRTGGTSASNVFSYINGSQSKLIGAHPSTSSASFTFNGWEDLEAGDELTIRTDASFTLDNVPLRHWISLEANPDFTAFGTFPEKNLVQTKYLSSDHTGTTSTTTLTDLTFSNLTVGKKYTVTMKTTSKSTNASGTAVNLRAIHNSNTKGRCLHDTADSDATFMTNLDEFTFKAETTTLTFEATLGNTGDVIYGDGSDNETRVKIVEHNDLRETDKF